MRPSCAGVHPIRAWVSALEAGMSSDQNIAIQPKCSWASSGEIEIAGTPR